jgi:diguanylate cyclase (GGDEF)-like protein
MSDHQAPTRAEQARPGLLALSERGLGAVEELVRVLREHERELSALLERIRRLEPLVWADGLTGLLNRQGLMQALRREEARARRYHLPAAVVVCAVADVDAVRAGHGPAAADALLQAVATALRDGSRGSDVVARIGDAAFAVVLPGADEAGARVYLERLCLNVGSVRLPDGAMAAVRLSAALGTREEAGSLSAALALAEGRLRAPAPEPSRQGAPRIDGPGSGVV